MFGGFHPMWFGFWGLGWPVMALIAVIPFWRICTRAGLSPWLSLLIIVPLANLIFIYYLAFTDWPAGRGGAGPGFGSGTGAVPPGPGPGPSAPGG